MGGDEELVVLRRSSSSGPSLVVVPYFPRQSRSSSCGIKFEKQNEAACNATAVTTASSNCEQDHVDCVASTKSSYEWVSLSAWSVGWGAYCRKTASKENQDGWLVCRAPIKRSSEKKSIETSFYRQSEHHQLDAWGCWTPQTVIVSENNDNEYTFNDMMIPINNHPASPLSDVAKADKSPFLGSKTTTKTIAIKTHRTQRRNLEDSAGCNSQSTVSLSTDKVVDTFDKAVNEVQNGLTVLRPWFFGVFDGHGFGGREASKIASMSVCEVLTDGVSSHLPPPKVHRLKNRPSRGNESGRHSPVLSSKHVSLLESTDSSARNRLERIAKGLTESFALAQQRIIQSNVACGRDYGTTAVVVACSGRFLVTATCGDSSAYLIATPSSFSKFQSGDSFSSQTNLPAVNVVLSCNHTLQSDAEMVRIQKENKGRVVIGDGGVRRLIPGKCTYHQAKMKGLSINMARALGHMVLSKLGLSPLPENTLVDLADVYATLWKHMENVKSNGTPYAEWAPLLFQARDFYVTLSTKFPDKDDDVQCNNNSAPSSPYCDSLKNDGDDESPRVVVETSPPSLKNAKWVDLLTLPEIDDRFKSAAELVATTDIFLLMVSDGVSDVMSRADMTLFILTRERQGVDLGIISEQLTEEAARIRTARKARADNCTAIIVKLKPSVDN